MRLRGVKTDGDGWRLEIDGTRVEVLHVLDVLRAARQVPRDPGAMWDDAGFIARVDLECAIEAGHAR